MAVKKAKEKSDSTRKKTLSEKAERSSSSKNINSSGKPVNKESGSNNKVQGNKKKVKESSNKKSANKNTSNKKEKTFIEKVSQEIDSAAHDKTVSKTCLRLCPLSFISITIGFFGIFNYLRLSLIDDFSISEVIAVSVFIPGVIFFALFNGVHFMRHHTSESPKTILTVIAFSFMFLLSIAWLVPSAIIWASTVDPKIDDMKFYMKVVASFWIVLLLLIIPLYGVLTNKMSVGKAYLYSLNNVYFPFLHMMYPIARKLSEIRIISTIVPFISPYIFGYLVAWVMDTGVYTFYFSIPVAMSQFIYLMMKSRKLKYGRIDKTITRFVEGKKRRGD